MAKILSVEQEKSIGMTEEQVDDMIMSLIDGDDLVSPNSSVRPAGETYGDFLLKPSSYLKGNVGV